MGTMFELIGDRNKSAIKWWTMPAMAFVIFACGVDVGVLVGRRSTDFPSWVELAFILLLAWRLTSPVFREVRERLHLKKD